MTACPHAARLNEACRQLDVAEAELARLRNRLAAAERRLAQIDPAWLGEPPLPDEQLANGGACT